jgi:transposase
MQWRRMRALNLSHVASSQRRIAAALGVSEPAVSRWLAVAQRYGADALRSHPTAGRVPQLTDEQLHLIPEFLWHDPETYVFCGQVGVTPRNGQNCTLSPDDDA